MTRCAASPADQGGAGWRGRRSRPGSSVWCPLLFDVLADDRNGRTATATGEIGRRPQRAFPVAGRDVLALLAQQAAGYALQTVHDFERAGLEPIPAPTGFKTGTERVRTLGYWLPSAGNLRKTERVVHETLGLRALELDHRGR